MTIWHCDYTKLTIGHRLSIHFIWQIHTAILMYVYVHSYACTVSLQRRVILRSQTAFFLSLGWEKSGLAMQDWEGALAGWGPSNRMWYNQIQGRPARLLAPKITYEGWTFKMKLGTTPFLIVHALQTNNKDIVTVLKHCIYSRNT